VNGDRAPLIANMAPSSQAQRGAFFASFRSFARRSLAALGMRAPELVLPPPTAYCVDAVVVELPARRPISRTAAC
jgi:hypothetical protein